MAENLANSHPAKPGGADTMEYDYTGELSGAVTADGEEVTRDGETISTETVDQNVGLAQNGGSLTLTDATLDKSGSDTNGDNCKFLRHQLDPAFCER